MRRLITSWIALEITVNLDVDEWFSHGLLMLAFFLFFAFNNISVNNSSMASSKILTKFNIIFIFLCNYLFYFMHKYIYYFLVVFCVNQIITSRSFHIWPLSASILVVIVFTQFILESVFILCAKKTSKIILNCYL